MPAAGPLLSPRSCMAGACAEPLRATGQRPTSVVCGRAAGSTRRVSMPDSITRRHQQTAGSKQPPCPHSQLHMKACACPSRTHASKGGRNVSRRSRSLMLASKLWRVTRPSGPCQPSRSLPMKCWAREDGWATREGGQWRWWLWLGWGVWGGVFGVGGGGWGAQHACTLVLLAAPAPAPRQPRTLHVA